MGEQCQTLFSDQSNQWKERILPWIDRELMVLLGPDYQTSTIYTVRTYLQSLVQRHGIRSSETVKNLTPFLYENTDRFLHELNAFCQSSLSLEDYDKYVQYARELPDQALKDAKESRDELYRILREV